MSLDSPSDAAEPAEPERLLEDPLAIRALAHPLRLDLLAVIGRVLSMTTAQAARELGISHGLASHHLRQLAKYHFVEQIDGKDHRERPWRATAASHRWPDEQATPAAAAATDVLERVLAKRVLDGFVRWQRSRPQWPAEWLDGSGLGTTSLYLTPAELAAMTAEFEAMISRYAEGRTPAPATDRPEGTALVDIAYFAAPSVLPARET
jgi:Helix-turn-helix domain